MSDALDPTAPGPCAAPDPGAAGNRNAVTHGLTARRPLCEEEAERMVTIAQQWTLHHRPETGPEEALIQSAAIEYVRYLRCVEAEEARLRPGLRDALAEWKEKKQHAVRRKAQGLADDPRSVIADLHESAFGIDWMLRNWRALLATLDAGRGWAGDDLAMALRLMGRAPHEPAASDVDGRRLWELAAAACPITRDAQAPAGLADAEAAGRLRAFVADRIARLDALRPVVWEEVDEPEARAVETAAVVDTSKEGQLRQRYRREAFGDYQRSLALILRLKVERSKTADRDAKRERREASTRPRGLDGWWRDANADPAPGEPPAVPPAAAAPASRNEPPQAAPDDRADRRNPNPDHALPPGTPAPAPAAPRRTWPRTEAHPAPELRPGPAPRRTADGPEGPEPRPRPSN